MLAWKGSSSCNPANADFSPATPPALVLHIIALLVHSIVLGCYWMIGVPRRRLAACTGGARAGVAYAEVAYAEAAWAGAESAENAPAEGAWAENAFAENASVETGPVVAASVQAAFAPRVADSRLLVGPLPTLHIPAFRSSPGRP
ncbi:hypothetical protein NMY22_g18156 [Coprinellus aureogranulatus]|nr:hypothetical protein NMY22_g18156 [Coprinellus aureogranulatus]